jgi:hypothetical protein
VNVSTSALASGGHVLVEDQEHARSIISRLLKQARDVHAESSGDDARSRPRTLTGLFRPRTLPGGYGVPNGN